MPATRTTSSAPSAASTGGEDYVDHHVLFCVHNEKTGLNHVSYEAQDIDSIFQDHEHIKGLGKYEHMWGIGRHLLGSQVFDYWADPWGRRARALGRHLTG